MMYFSHNARWQTPSTLPSRPPLIWPHPLLTHAVAAISRDYPVKALASMAAELVSIMQTRGAVGLAANQVGYAVRMFVMQPTPGDEPKVFLNPTWQIVPALPAGSRIQVGGATKLLPADPGSREVLRAEGCLSLPGYEANVPRWDRVCAEYLDLDGWRHGLGGSMEELTDIRARIYQHEVDHLDGKAIPDHLSRLTRDQVRRKMTKLQKRMR